MARHDYNDDFNSSVNRYRREVEKSYKRREREEAEQARRNSSFKKSVRDVARPAQNLARDAIMHAKINDPTTNEIRNVKRTAGMITGFVSGAALAVASAAVSGLKASEIDDKARRLANDTASLQNDYRQLENSLNQLDNERRTMTLSAYNEDVASRTDYYRTSYYGELDKREETKRQIDAESKQNRQAYESSMKELDSERSQETSKYKEASENSKRQYETIQSEYDKKIDSEKKSYEQKIESVNKTYDNRISDIKSSSLSNSEKAEKISSVNREREDKKQEATNIYEKSKEEILSKKAEATQTYKNLEVDRKQSYDRKMESLDTRAEGLKSEYGKKQSDLKIRDQESIKEMNRAKDEYLQKYVNRTEAREMPRDNSSLQELKPRGTQLETKLGPVSVQGVPIGFVTSRSVENIRDTMGQLNTDLAKRAIMELGTPEDRRLLDKYERDEEARKRAEAVKEPHVSTLSDDERKRVQTAIKAFGGTGFDSESDLKMTLKNSQRAAAAIQSRLDENKGLLATSRASYENSVKELKGMRSQVTDSINAKKALASGKNLSDAEKAQLKSKILSKKDENDLRGKIKKGEKDLEKDRNKLNNLQNKIKRQEVAVAGINKQTQFLKRNGKALTSGAIYKDNERSLRYKAIATKKENKANALEAKRKRAIQKGNINKASKLKLKVSMNQRAAERAGQKRIAAMKKRSKSERGKKMAKRAERKWRNSVRALQKRLESKTLNGNVLHSEFKRIKRTTKNAAQYYTMAVNGAITITKVAAKMIFAPLTITNFIGKRLNAKQAKILGRQKNGVRLTRGQAIWARRMQNSRFLQRSMRLNARVTRFTNSKGFRHVTRAGRNFLMAPAAVLTLPNKIMNLPQTMMMGAAKGTAKLAGKAVGLAVRPLGKGIRVGGRALGRGAKFIHRRTAGRAINRLRNSRFGRAASKNFRRITSRIAAPFRRAGQRVRNFFSKSPFALIRKLFAWLLSIVASIASYIFMFIIYLLLLVVLLMLVLLLIILVIALIFSVIAMILDWLYKLTAQSDTEIRNHPGYVLHMASNYRSEELRIFYYFYKGAQNKHGSDDKVLLEVSKDPLWCEVYDANFHWDGESFEIGGTNVTATQKLNDAYEYHKETKLSDGKTFEINKTTLDTSDWAKTVFSWFFKELSIGATKPDDWVAKSDVTNYSELWVAYLIADGDLLKENGDANEEAIEEKLKNLTGDEGKYEVSNAKDALAIGDSVFEAKQEECQTFEILAYLGVGATQPVGGASNTIPASKTLFWTSHNIVYLTGTDSQDIYYHGISDVKDTLNNERRKDSENHEHRGHDYTYSLLTNHIYDANGNEIESPGSVDRISDKDINNCNNHETRTFSFDRSFEIEVKHPRHVHTNNTVKNGRDYMWPTQAKEARTKKNDNSTAFNPPSSSKTGQDDYWYWYQDLEIRDGNGNPVNLFNFNSWGNWCKPEATTVGNVQQFMVDVYGVKLSTTPPTLIATEKNEGDAIYIKDCEFDKIYAFKNDSNEFLLVGKSPQDGKFYQVLSKKDTKKVIGPLADGLYIGGNNGGSASTPFVTVLYKVRKERDGTVCYAPKLYYESGKLNQANHFKLAVSRDICWPIMSWVRGWSGDENLNDLCRNHSGLSYWHSNTVTEYLDLACNEIFEICHGHITLRTVVVVTTAESKYSIFDKAAKLPEQEGNFEFALYYKDDLAGVDGWGGVDVKAFKPAEDFAPHGSARGLALAKAREKNIFYDWDDDYDDKVSEYKLRGVSSKPQSIKKVDGKVSWAMYNFAGDLYYTTSLKSGSQKNLIVYDTDEKKGYLSLATDDGKAKYLWPNAVQ